MKLIISKEILELFPKLRIGLLTGFEINNTQYPKNINELRKDAINYLTSNHSLATITENPVIKAWKEIYQIIGINPKKYKPSAEALALRILKGERFQPINPLVDLYLIAQAQCLHTIGGYDLDKIYNNIYLRKSLGEEKFVPIGKNILEYTKTNEIIYSDDKNVLTRRWNHRDADITKITKNTKNFILFIEAPTNQIRDKDLEESINQLKHIMINHLQGTFSTYFLVCSRTTEFKIPYQPK